MRSTARSGARQDNVAQVIPTVVLTKKWGRPHGVSPIGLAGWQLTAAGLVLLLPALLIDGVPPRIDGTAWLGYAWLGIIGALVTYTIWFSGIRRLPVTATALLGLLSPLVAAILGALIAGEALTLLQLLGFALALIAMVAGQLPSPKRKVDSARQPNATQRKNLASR